jgi:hypothetical protein
VLTNTRRFFGSLFSLSGLMTLVPVVAGYAMLAAWLDRRAARAAAAPEAGPAPPGRDATDDDARPASGASDEPDDS